MKNFEEFQVGKDRTIFNKPTDKYPNGHVGVMTYEHDYNNIQIDAFKAGLEYSAKLCVSYANLMRGAHVNTNDSSADIRKCILADKERLLEIPKD